MGCLIAMVVILIAAALWGALQNVYAWMTGHKAEHAQLLIEARDGVAQQENAVANIRAHGTLKRLMWDAAKSSWVYEGENETMGTYAGGLLGECRLECRKEIAPNLEGGFLQREFTAVFNRGTGLTLITRQGPLSEGVSTGMQLVVEKQRPAAATDCDRSTGWSLTTFGAWPGSGPDGLRFSELLDGKRAGAAVTASSDEQQGFPTIKIRAASSATIDYYWLDINRAYAFLRWERRAVEGKTERLVESADMLDFWLAPGGIYYPRRIEGQKFGPDGKAAEKWRVETSEMWANETMAGDAAFTLHPPAGEIVIKQAGEADRTIEGSADENAAAIAKAAAGAENK